MARSSGGVLKRLLWVLVVLLVFAPVTAAAEAVYLRGDLTGFANRNYNSYIPAPGWMLGERVRLSAEGPLFDKRLLRYRIGGDLTDGRSFGLADKITLLDRQGRLGLYLLPLHWYNVNLIGEAGALDLVDGPAYSWDERHRGLGVETSIRPPLKHWPAIYASYYDYRYNGDFTIAPVEENRRQLSARYLQRLSKDLSLDIAYDWVRLDERIFDSGYSRHNLYADGFSRLGTDTTLNLQAFGVWHNNTFRGRSTPSTRQLGTRLQASHQLDAQNDFQGNHRFSLLTGTRLYVQNNDLSGIWYHRLNEALRTAVGAEFAHTATDGVLEGFAYQKYREAAILGGDADYMLSVFEFTPSYYLRAGAVQLQDGAGGLYQSHDAGFPILMRAVEALPMSLSGFVTLERDSSDVPTYRLYRALTYRADFFSVASQAGSIVTSAYLIATRARTDREIVQYRERTDTTSFSVFESTELRQLYTRLTAAYTVTFTELDRTEFTTHVATGQWEVMPVPRLRISNRIEIARTNYVAGYDGRLTYRAEAGYTWRSLDITAGYRYDDYVRGRAEWGFFTEIRRSFGFGV